MGKSVNDAEMEVDKSISHIDFYIKNADTFLKQHERKDSRGNTLITSLKP